MFSMLSPNSHVTLHPSVIVIEFSPAFSLLHRCFFWLEFHVICADMVLYPTFSPADGSRWRIDLKIGSSHAIKVIM